jgi:hypothetical protein
MTRADTPLGPRRITCFRRQHHREIIDSFAITAKIVDQIIGQPRAIAAQRGLTHHLDAHQRRFYVDIHGKQSVNTANFRAFRACTLSALSSAAATVMRGHTVRAKSHSSRNRCSCLHALELQSMDWTNTSGACLGSIACL